MLLGLYRGGGWLAPPVARLMLMRRRARGNEHPERFRERQGHPRRPRPDGALIWLHAASVGEAQSVLPLIGRLLARLPAAHAMVTSGTVTSAQLMEERLPARAYHQFVPADCPAWVRRFLNHYRPDLALWVESELWPTLLTETARRAAAAVLLNGRMSERSFRRWRRFPGAARRLVGTFDLVMAQSANRRRPFPAARRRAGRDSGQSQDGRGGVAGRSRRARRIAAGHRRAAGLARRQHPPGRGREGRRSAPGPCGGNSATPC